MSNVTVYSKPNCVQCEQTKRYLDLKSIAYNIVDITEDEVALNKVLEMGYKSAPVVIVDDPAYQEAWSGFRLDSLSKLAERFGA
jgi:glutaredoxin-like protein NrdH